MENIDLLVPVFIVIRPVTLHVVVVDFISFLAFFTFLTILATHSFCESLGG